MNIKKALLVLEKNYVCSKTKQEENIYQAIKDIIIALDEPLKSDCIHYDGHGWDILVPGPQSMRKCIYCGKIEDMPSYDKVQADANRKPYQMAYDISHPDVIDLATEKAFNAGRLFERKIINNQK